jgi:hypothetical protein
MMFLKKLNLFWFHLEERDVAIAVEDAEVVAEVAVNSWAEADDGGVEADGGGVEVGGGGVEVGGGGVEVGGGGVEVGVARTDSLTDA